MKYEDVVNQIDQKRFRGIVGILAIITALGGFLFGYDTGIIGSALVYAGPAFHLTPYETSWLVAGTSLFAAVGAFVAGPLVDRYGRKSLLLADGAIYFVFAILSAIATTALQLILWRAIIGFAVGADTAIAAGYIAEFSPTKIRGLTVAMQQNMTFAGILASFWIAYFLTRLGPISWRWMLGVGAIPALILLIFRTYLPESPRWLLVNGRQADARKALARMGINVTEDIESPKREAGYREFFRNKAAVKATLIVGGLLMFQQITGVNVVLYYGPYIYKYIGLSGPRSILLTGILELIGILGYTLATLWVDKYGRKKLALGGYTIMALGMAIVTGGLYVFTHNIIMLAASLIFTGEVVFQLGFKFAGLVGVVMSGESVQTEFRGRGEGTMWTIDWLANYVIIMIFPLWLATYGGVSFFILEVILCVLAVIYIYKFIPETMHIRVEEIPKVFTSEKESNTK